MQEWYLGRQKVSLLERCPQFRGVLIEGFHCNCLRLLVVVIYCCRGDGSDGRHVCTKYHGHT